ncbi:MAG: DciA family protein [Gammaproteobacteria bacterium]
MKAAHTKPRPPGKSCATLLNSAGGELGYLLEHCKRLECMSRLLRDRLPPPFGPHCQIGGIVRQTLILHADSAAWASKLRYYCPQLLADLCQQPDFRQISDIRVKVVPHQTVQSSRQPVRRRMPPSATRLLLAVAAATPASPLKEALLRLASREQD